MQSTHTRHEHDRAIVHNQVEREDDDPSDLQRVGVRDSQNFRLANFTVLLRLGKHQQHWTLFT